MDRLQQLKERVAEVMDLRHALALLEWDQQTYMPSGGNEARAEQISTLSKIAHQKFTSPEVGQLLEDLAPEMESVPYDSDEAALVRRTKREYDRRTKLPMDLVARFARITSLAHETWVHARQESNFAIFAPTLAEIVELEIETAEAYGYLESIYDPLMDGFEPGMKTLQLKQIFAEFRDGLVPIVQAIVESPHKVDRRFLEQKFAIQQQEAFSLELLKGIGYDFQRGRQDRTAHPFTTTFSSGDVRVTNRFMEDLMTSSIFSAIHEGGHALYDQGIPPRFDRTPLAFGASFGVHESQSRMWENIVGRNLHFWKFWFPLAQKAFPGQLDDVSVEGFWQAINTVEPSAIRVESDEVTYNLHIMLRFEVEMALLERKIATKDLPEIWNAKMEEYLGYQVKNDAEGVLQDVHWSGGSFGYFPSYSLGNLLSVQYFTRALEDIPDLYRQFERGEYGGLLTWLHENIHVYGGKYMPAELTEKVTGGPISPQPFLAYLRKKYGEIYGI
ncbi:MAG: carboxypeptidase M32 [bacterium]